jgi:hypothetical protein
MKVFVLIFISLFFTLVAQASSESCRFDSKDYDSPGFAIPKRSGFQIVARFGCVYRCTCDNGSVWMVNHVLEEKHFDLAFLSKETGGPRRAKWFICPHSIQEDSWKPINDELGRPIAYNVEVNYEPFPVEKMSSSPQIRDWLQNSCQKP